MADKKKEKASASKPIYIYKSNAYLTKFFLNQTLSFF
jgi:hypothetical protein